MEKLYFTRRNFLSCGAGALLTATQLRSQTPQIPVAEVTVKDYKPRSSVVVISGESRRKNVHDALAAIDRQILPKLKSKKRVVIKPNDVSPTNQLASVDADAIRGVLDYLLPRFKGPITIAESCGDTWAAFENFKYPDIVKEFKSRKIELIDLNEDGRYVHQAVLDQDTHVVPVRLAARLFDPDAFIIGLGLLKSHNYAVVSLGVKNMVLGAPLHQTRAEAKSGVTWLDKRRYHAGIRQSLYNIYVTAARLKPFWGATVIDGFEGRENSGFVQSKVAIASTDYVAADRVGSEAMGVNHEWLGWLKYCGESGVGQWDLAKIDIRGNKLEEVRKEYRLHPDIELQLRWMGPMEELPPTLGWLTPLNPKDVDAYVNA
jgi:uncharacterized protein (DUF362 family)